MTAIQPNRQKFDPSKYKVDDNIPPMPMSDRKKWLMSLKPGQSFVLDEAEYSVFHSAVKDLRKAFPEFKSKFIREDETHYRFHRLKLADQEETKPDGE